MRLPACLPVFSVTQKAPPQGTISAVAPLAVFQLPTIGSAAAAVPAMPRASVAVMSKVRNIPVLQIEAAGVVRSAGSFRCPRMQKGSLLTAARTIAYAHVKVNKPNGGFCRFFLAVSSRSKSRKSWRLCHRRSFRG
ncbi:hypothetical protein D9M70_561400 [compost metagenome]